MSKNENVFGFYKFIQKLNINVVETILPWQ